MIQAQKSIFNILGRILLVVAVLALVLPVSTPAQSAAPRRVNIPFFSSGLPWEQSAIFWFGQNKQGIPSLNYVDVRMAYTPTELKVRVTVVDYYLWFKNPGSLAEDLTKWDAVAIYLDTQHDRASSPQTDDYMFLSGARHWEHDNKPEYKRQARGNGSGWNTAWTGAWTDYSYMSWSDKGPNDNSGNLDYGWESFFSIPWSTLGLSGPPANASLWGLGVRLFDRDASAESGILPVEFWPESFNANNPSTWGELHFGYASYQPPPAVEEGTTIIRRSTSTDTATVIDSYMGGGGWCASGHEGGTEVNHGADERLFVGTETAPTHFPCFNKSYLRFSLGNIPPGKVILSATLSIYLWGNAGAPGEAQRSWVHLFSVKDSWNEMTIHWNNAPLAQENVAATWMYPYSKSTITWPGDEYQWDATKAVAEAYATGSPVSLAIYGADTDQHSSKYLTSSDVEDWNTNGRPRLTVVWGSNLPSVEVLVSPKAAKTGDTVTYTVNIRGTGSALSLEDNLPSQVSAPSSITPAGSGASYNSGSHRITWSGSPSPGQIVSFSFPVTVVGSGRQAVTNTAVISGDGKTSQSSAVFIIDPLQSCLPLIRR